MVKLVEQNLTSASVFKMILTFCDTCMLFSCMFMMASEIFTSIGSTTDSKLKGPSSLSARLNMASEKHRGREGIEIKLEPAEGKAKRYLHVASRWEHIQSHPHGNLRNQIKASACHRKAASPSGGGKLWNQQSHRGPQLNLLSHKSTICIRFSFCPSVSLTRLDHIQFKVFLTQLCFQRLNKKMSCFHGDHLPRKLFHSVSRSAWLAKHPRITFRQ